MIARLVRSFRGRTVGSASIAADLVSRQANVDPRLRELFDEYSDELAERHFGDEEPLQDEWLRRVVRYFHAWRIVTLRDRLGDRLDESSIVDVGDSDGHILKALGKMGIGVNLSPAAIRNIEANGVEAVLADAHALPFEDASTDCVLCFETLEHVESPVLLLEELARICKPNGAVFVSIPWVPRTFIHARLDGVPRGREHVFEFSRDDFARVVSHTRLAISWEAVCDLFGPATDLRSAMFLGAWRGSHIVAGSFRRFQFFELRRR